MRYIVLLSLLLLFNTADGQKRIPAVKAPEKTVICVSIRPRFKQGTLNEYIRKNCRYPQVAKENNIEGYVQVRFMIDEQGKVCNVTLLNKRRLGGGCEEEALRVISAMPEWLPGRYCGRKVRTVETVRILFKLG